MNAVGVIPFGDRLESVFAAYGHLCLGIDQDVHDTLTTGWFAARRAGDGHVATVSCVLTLAGPVDQPLDLRFRRRSVDHDLRAMLRYSVAVR